MEAQGNHRPSSKSKSDKDSTESGNETPNVAMQFEDGVPKENLGVRNRDFSNSEVARNQSFTFNATGQAGFLSLGQSQIFNEVADWGGKPIPRTSQDMVGYDDYMSDEYDPSQSDFQNRQSLSSVKEEEGDIFRSKADIKEKLKDAGNQIFFVNIPSGGVCPNNTSFSKAIFDFSFFPNKENIRLWNLWKPCVDALNDTPSPDPNIERACQRLIDVCSRKGEILKMLLGKWDSEIEFNYFLATQIIQQLSGGTCMVNRIPRGSSADKEVVTPREIGVDGLGIGYKGGWYGETDMIVCPPDNMDLQGLGGTSTPHRPNSPGRCVVEGKHATLPGKSLLKLFSQSVATLAIFADIQRRRHPKKHTTFPMLWVGMDGVVVLIYDRVNDIFMISNIISWDGCEAVAAIWAAVSYNLFPALDLSQFKQYECGLKAKLDEMGKEVEQYWYLVSRANFKDSKDNSSSILPRYKAV